MKIFTLIPLINRAFVKSECPLYCDVAADLGQDCVATRGVKTINQHRMFPFGIEHGDTEGLQQNDVCSAPIDFSDSPLKIFGQTFTTLYATDNANIQFGACNSTYNLGVPPPYSVSGLDANFDFSQGGKWYYRKVTDETELSTLGAIIATAIDQQGLFVALTGFIVTYINGVRHDAINDAMVSLQIQVASDGGATFATFQYGDVEWTKSVEELNENPFYQLPDGDPNGRCIDTKPGTATINPCNSSDCPNVVVSPVVHNQGYESGNGLYRGQYIFSIDDPNPIKSPPVPSPPPPAWWNPGVTGEIKVNLGSIDDFIDVYFPNYTSIKDHGCQCRNAFQGKKSIDLKSYRDGGLDNRCGAFIAARDCVFLEGGICFGRESEDLSYTINNGTCLESQDTCEGTVCRIDIFFYRKIMGTIEDIDFSNDVAVLDVPISECRKGTCSQLAVPPEGGCGGNTEYVAPQCCGHAHRVAEYRPDRGTCSSSGGSVIKPNIYACSRNAADITIIVDISVYSENTFTKLRSFLHDWTASMGIGEDTIYNIVTYDTSAQIHASNIDTLYDLSDACESITQSSATTRNTFAALDFVYNLALKSLL